MVTVQGSGRGIGVIGMLITMVLLSVSAHASAVGSSTPVEDVYAARGPATTVSETLTDASGASYVVFRPIDLGPPGTRHPVVTWGNGTGGAPGNYAALLDHLASWGIVVVASTSGQTAGGEEMVAAARLIVALDGTPASPLADRIATDRIAAAGHSQGAGGTVNATTASDGLITTAVPVALPAPVFVGAGGDFDVAALRVPVLFLGGMLDLLAPPSAQSAYYSRVSGAAASAARRLAGHLEVQGDGNGLRGYLTAWLRYQLADDPVARSAFVGDPPEIAVNPAWTGYESKRLP